MRTHHQNGFSMLLILALFFPLSLPASPDSAALLAFKSSLVGSATLSTWANSSSPCSGSWLGVACDPSTRRVTRLVLENLGLAGDLRPLGRLPELRVLSLKLNRFSSSLPGDLLSSWPNLKQLHLSHNEFSGEFPVGIGRLRRLRRINLSYNNFSGVIPLADLVRVPRLLTLRLEANSFVGALISPAPSSASITDFNVSGNRLTGEIPEWLSQFPATAYAGNKDLCGKPLPYNCKPEEEPSAVSAPKTHRSKDIKKILTFVAVDAAIGLGVILIVVWCCCKNHKYNGDSHKEGPIVARGIFSQDPVGKGEMVVFEGCKGGFDHVEDLLKASAELLGKGSIGTTYKVALESTPEGLGGLPVVVKRVRSGRWRRREVDGWLKLIGGLRHPNMASLRACYQSTEELLLVYDYIRNGSLYSRLHENRGPGRTPLSWITRMKIASDTARGLAFLHQHSKPKLFHGRLSTSNIVIDHLGNALISDAGIARLFPAPPAKDPNHAPELNPKANINRSNLHPKYTQHCDVYSFGVVLLEILTGKTAVGEGETGLVNWVRRVSERQGSGKEVFDFEVFLSGIRDAVEAEMEEVLQVALLCVATAPRDRPKMGVVCKMIEDIRTKGGSGSEGLTSYASHVPSSDSSPALSESAS